MSMVTTMEKTLLDCEQYIEEALAEHATAQCPPLLAQALNYAVFPGGARVRPQLCTVSYTHLTLPTIFRV